MSNALRVQFYAPASGFAGAGCLILGGCVEESENFLDGEE